METSFTDRGHGIHDGVGGEFEVWDVFCNEICPYITATCCSVGVLHEA